MGPPGLEPRSLTSSKTKELQEPEIPSAAESGAVESKLDDLVAKHPDWEHVVRAWGQLSEPVRVPDVPSVFAPTLNSGSQRGSTPVGPGRDVTGPAGHPILREVGAEVPWREKHRNSMARPRPSLLCSTTNQLLMLHLGFDDARTYHDWLAMLRNPSTHPRHAPPACERQ